MKVVVGLGNPGRQYADTPHNVGALVIDELAGRLVCTIRRNWRLKALIGKTVVNDIALWLVKPQVFMNVCGPVVAAVLRKAGIGPTDLIVAMDDADLELGRLRIRASGSSGGHRGLASVIENVGTDKFVRVRIGIGRGADRRDLISHVLSPFSLGEKERIRPAIERAAEAVVCVLESGIEVAMNRYNVRANSEFVRAREE
ncbi:MAG: aminoacyl-tRNA hydrolase [Kiritimatiellia bacterium]